MIWHKNDLLSKLEKKDSERG